MLLAVGARVLASENHLFKESAGRALGIGADSCWLRVPLSLSSLLLWPSAHGPGWELSHGQWLTKEEGRGSALRARELSKGTLSTNASQSGGRPFGTAD